jgi:uncharacterized protein YndB with AHSA1/START domain
MAIPDNVRQSMLQIRRTFAAPRERVFRAWTEPDELRKWWGAGEGFSAPIAEVDLRVGGKYRLGMKPPDSDDLYICTGAYREVSPPEKLVYTWAWEGMSTDAEETLVTVEFHDLGGSTEIVVTHELFPDEKARDEHAQGWSGCLDMLVKALEAKKVDA